MDMKSVEKENGDNSRNMNTDVTDVNRSQSQEEVHKKDIGGKVIRTSGYRHKKRRNKHLFISDEDSPSQIRYNYKYERVNSEKKREKQIEEIMEKNQSSNVEQNQKSSSNKQKFQENYYDYHPSQLYTFYKASSEYNNDTYDKETTDTNVHINNKFPLNHLYEAFIYLGQSRSIRKSKAWYDSRPLFLVDFDAKAKNQESQVTVQKLSLSIASVYANNNSPKEWHLVGYNKRNPKDGVIKAGANFSKKIMDQAAEIKRTKKRSNSTAMEDVFEGFSVPLIHYPDYNPFDAEDGAQEDYEPFYDYQAKLNKFINNNVQKNDNDNSLGPFSVSSKTSNIPSETSTHSSENEIISGAQAWNNYIKSRQELKIKHQEIRSNTIAQIKEATERRKRMVQRPSPQNKKASVSFNFNSSQEDSNKQNSPNRKHHHNNKKDNKNSTYAKYVASYSIYNDINKLMQQNNSGYPINYNNVIERINNYYNNGGSYQTNVPIQQYNNYFYNTHQNNNISNPNNYNNTTNKNSKNNQNQQKPPQTSKYINVNIPNNSSFNATKSPISASSKSEHSPYSDYSPISPNSTGKQNIINSPYLMSNENGLQQHYFSNSYSYSTNHVNTSSVQNKPRFFNQPFKQKSTNNDHNETSIKNRDSTKKHINISP